MIRNDSKKFFLVASGNSDRTNQITEWIHEKYIDAVVYTASDFFECVSKLKNVAVHILITDNELPKARAGEIIDNLLLDKKSKTAMVVLDSKINSESQSDAVALGKMFFLEHLSDYNSFQDAILKVSNYAFHSEVREFNLKNLKSGEILIRENDECKNVYIVRKGELRAYTTSPGGEQILLGNVHMGEFVGEMAYFIGKNRMATVEAITDCEVIEVPAKVFERVIYQRPSWVKTLFETLARRLSRKTELQKETKV